MKEKRVLFLAGLGLFLLFSIPLFFRNSKVNLVQLISREISSDEWWRRRPNNEYFTINQKVKVSGPVLKEGDTETYLNQLFSVLLNSGQKFPQILGAAGDWKAVNAFLLSSLAVPYHESKLLHFRYLNELGDSCVEKRHHPAFPMNVVEEWRDQIAANKSKGDEEKKKAEGLRAEVDELNRQVNKLENEAKTLRNNAKSIQANTDELVKKVVKLRSEADAKEAQASTLSDKLSNLKNEAGNLEKNAEKIYSDPKYKKKKSWANSLEKIDKTFQSYLRKGAEGQEAPIVGCKDLNPKNPAIQLIGSGADYLSLGMFQATMRFHVDNFVRPRAYLSVFDTVDYGLGFYYKGFIELYQKAKTAEDLQDDEKNSDKSIFTSSRYGCLFESYQDQKTKKIKYRINYFNLVRGAWSGNFNSGSNSNACRFTDKSSLWKDNDDRFEEDFNSLVSLENSKVFGYLDATNKEIYKELVQVQNRQLANFPAAISKQSLLADDLKQDTTNPKQDSVNASEAPKEIPNLQEPEKSQEAVAQPVTQTEPAPQVVPNPDLKPETPSSTAQSNLPEGKIVNCEKVNLRLSAPRGSIVTVLSLGDSVKVISKEQLRTSLWFKVTSGQHTGWLNSKYVQLQ